MLYRYTIHYPHIRHHSTPDADYFMNDQPQGSTHPGLYVREHVLPRGLTVTEAAKRMGVGRPALSNFLNGKAALSPAMAVRLERTFGANREALLDLQTRFDARGATDGHRAITAATYAPSVLAIKAREIEAWAGRIEARQETRGACQKVGQLHRSRSFQGGLPRSRPRGASRVGWRGGFIDTNALDTGERVRLGIRMQRESSGQGQPRLRGPREIGSTAGKESVHVCFRDTARLARQDRVVGGQEEAWWLEGRKSLRRFRPGAMDRTIGSGPDLVRRTSLSTSCRLSIAVPILDGLGIRLRAGLVTTDLHSCGRTPLRTVPRVAQ